LFRTILPYDEFEGKRVRVEGGVTDVCPKAGCWILIEGGEQADLMVKVTDGVIVFPMEAIGKFAVAEGVANNVEMDLEQTRNHLEHLAEEKGQAFDRESVTEPMTYVRLAGTGAVIRDTE
jgi:hypothetical protein